MSIANANQNVAETTPVGNNGQPTPTSADATTQTVKSATPTTGNAAEMTNAATRLTNEIKGQLDQLAASVRKTTETAYQIGVKLKELQKLVKAAKKSWEQWVNENLPVEKRQVQKYMRLADRWAELKDPSSMTIEQCLAVLTKPKGPFPGVDKVKSKEVATKLTDTGFSLSGTSELKDKKLLANELQESEQFFAAESEEKKFVADKLAALVRQIRQIAQPGLCSSGYRTVVSR